MLNTEEVAKTKWCPFSRYELRDGGVNRWKQSLPEDEPHALNPVPCRCIASDCMAWRWWNTPLDNRVRGESNPRWVGYCGLAGDARPF